MKNLINLLLFMILLIISGCSISKKLQRNYGFSDTCRASYEFFLDNIIREKDELMEITEPIIEVYTKLYNSHTENIKCWATTLPEEAVINMFGIPHKRTVGQRTESVTIRYYIRTDKCMNLESTSRLDEDCGVLMFTFSKNGNPKSSVFYAFRPAKNEKD